jgi:hypothetical protein
MGYSVRLGERRKPRALSVLEQDRLHNRLVRVTPSEPWRDHCKGVVYAGEVPFKTKIERKSCTSAACSRREAMTR